MQINQRFSDYLKETNKKLKRQASMDNLAALRKGARNEESELQKENGVQWAMFKNRSQDNLLAAPTDYDSKSFKIDRPLNNVQPFTSRLGIDTSRNRQAPIVSSYDLKIPEITDRNKEMIQEWRTKSTRSRTYLQPVLGSLPSKYQVVSSRYNSGDPQSTGEYDQINHQSNIQKQLNNIASVHTLEAPWAVEVHSTSQNDLSVLHTFQKVDQHVVESTEHRSVKRNETPLKKEKELDSLEYNKPSFHRRPKQELKAIPDRSEKQILLGSKRQLSAVVTHHAKQKIKQLKQQSKVTQESTQLSDQQKKDIRLKSIGKGTKEKTEMLTLKIMKSNRQMLIGRLKQKSTNLQTSPTSISSSPNAQVIIDKQVGERIKAYQQLAIQSNQEHDWQKEASPEREQLENQKQAMNEAYQKMNKIPTDIFAIQNELKRQQIKQEVNRITNIVYDQLNRDEFGSLAESNTNSIRQNFLKNSLSPEKRKANSKQSLEHRMIDVARALPSKTRKKLSIDSNRILEPDQRKEAYVKGYLNEFFLKHKNI